MGSMEGGTGGGTEERKLGPSALPGAKPNTILNDMKESSLNGTDNKKESKQAATKGDSEGIRRAFAVGDRAEGRCVPLPFFLREF